MKLSIIMYHYVRDLSTSKYPSIKGLETSKFREQIVYIKKHYHVISGHELLAAVKADRISELPPNAALLTLDDGYADHYDQVWPILCQEKIAGCFFPVAKCVIEGNVLAVNKLHFILACAPDTQAIIDEISSRLNEYGAGYDTMSLSKYWNKLGAPGRYDSAEVVFIKQMLQRELPKDLRQIIVDELFSRFVTADEPSFARELYMSANQLMEMRQSGMTIGSHGYAHEWLDGLGSDEQNRDIQLSLDFLAKNGLIGDSWIMCYPYGAYNDSLRAILRRMGCLIGLSTRVDVADLALDDLLALPRLDTNDLPTSASAEMNDWTRKHVGMKLYA